MFTKSQEDYLETIYTQIQNGKNPRAIDIANEFNISRASVSEALIKLTELNLIEYESRKYIKITPKGEFEAKRILNKHKVLTKFLNEILGIEITNSNKNACRIEHVIEQEIIDKIEKFNSFCMNNSINKAFQKDCHD